MPRHGRFVVVGHPQHIVSRGNNRQAIFCCNKDYSFYLEKLKAGCEKYGVINGVDQWGQSRLVFNKRKGIFLVL